MLIIPSWMNFQYIWLVLKEVMCCPPVRGGSRQEFAVRPHMSLINGRWLNNQCCSRSNSQYHRSSNTITEPEAREILGLQSLRHCILLFLDWYWSALLMNSSLYQFFR